MKDFSYFFKKAVVATAASAVALGIMLSVSTEEVSAHGYIVNDRAFLGSQDGKYLNKNMGSATYEPQSVGEHGKRYSLEEGRITLEDAVSAGSGRAGRFPALKEYGKDRFHRIEMAPGKNDISWYFTAPHSTIGFDYYISKPGYDPNKPLDFKDFEKIASFNDYNGKLPAAAYQLHTHQIEIPKDRVGDHAILGAWHIADVNVTWYKIMDITVKNDGSVTPPEMPNLPESGDNNHNHGGGNNGGSNNGGSNNGGSNNGGSNNGGSNNGGSNNGGSNNSGGNNGGGNNGGGNNSNTPGQQAIPLWDKKATYVSGNKVEHNGDIWKAGWWTRGEEPGTTGKWGVWKKVGPAPTPSTPTPAPEPTPTPTPPPIPDGELEQTVPDNPVVQFSYGQVFKKGQKVTYEGKKYEALKDFTYYGDTNWLPAEPSLWKEVK